MALIDSVGAPVNSLARRLGGQMQCLGKPVGAVPESRRIGDLYNFFVAETLTHGIERRLVARGTHMRDPIGLVEHDPLLRRKIIIFVPRTGSDRGQLRVVIAQPACEIDVVV